MTPPLRTRRAARTRAARLLRHTIAWALESPAPVTGPDGLPSWWRHAGNLIVEDTRRVVRLARTLPEWPALDSDTGEASPNVALAVVILMALATAAPLLFIR